MRVTVTRFKNTYKTRAFVYQIPTGFQRASMWELFGNRIGKLIWNIRNPFVTYITVNSKEHGTVNLTQIMKVKTRIKAIIYGLLTGENYVMFGARELRIYTQGGEGFLCHEFAHNIRYEQGALSFEYLVPMQEVGQPGKSTPEDYKWPDREPNETPLAYRKRCAALPGISEYFVGFDIYESTVSLGYYSYLADNPDLMLYEFTDAETTNKKDAVKRAKERGIRVVSDKDGDDK